MTFRVRTALVVLALTAITMGGAFAAVWERFVSAQRRQLDDALIVVARVEAADAAAGHLEFTDEPGPTANAVGPLPKYGVLYGVDGAPMTKTSNFTTVLPIARTAPVDEGFDFDHEGMPMRGVVVRVGNTGRHLLLAVPRLDFEEDAHILAHAMTIAFFVGCLWAAVVAFSVATGLTRQHGIVGDVARRVASGDTSARVAFRSSDADLRQLATDLNAMIERLVGLLAAQERFIAHAAHELRTPLTSLRIEIELALQEGQDGADHTTTLRGALESAQRLTELAEDLLELARLKAAPTDEVTALDDALADAIANVAPLGRTRGITIVAAPIAAHVRGDRRGLARLFRNILENGVRFSPSNGRVRVEGRIESERVVIEVTDEGRGVSAADVERIFEPFTRGVRDDGADGSGLGLTIARGLARGVGGDVTAKHGAGGCFFVQLDRARSRET